MLTEFCPHCNKAQHKKYRSTTITYDLKAETKLPLVTPSFAQGQKKKKKEKKKLHQGKTAFWAVAGQGQIYVFVHCRALTDLL